jgi:sulfite exporter TauE/SafE
MIYTAFIMGLVGSLHCLSMCGPISLLVPTKPGKYLFYKSIYNAGRICTYVLLGLSVGLIGEQTSLYLPQKFILLGGGFILLLVAYLPQSWKNQMQYWKPVQRAGAHLRKHIGQFAKKRQIVSQFAFGMVNGIIPCGLVYAAIGGAFLTQNLQDGAQFMLFFGLGTVPMMMSFGLIGKYFTLKIRPKYIYTFSYLLLAVFFLYKGFHLPTFQTHGEMTVCTAP